MHPAVYRRVCAALTSLIASLLMRRALCWRLRRRCTQLIQANPITRYSTLKERDRPMLSQDSSPVRPRPSARRFRRLHSTCVAALAWLALVPDAVAKPIEYTEIKALASTPPDARLTYGRLPSQFGELWLPKGKGPFPVAVIVHGGCWQAAFSLDHVRSLAAAVRDLGFATWSIEYRRIGEPGGGWPNTLLDVGAGLDHLRVVAKTYPLDLQRVTVLGHSAGGHLALWAAARADMKPTSALHTALPLPVHHVIGLAAISDLTAYAAGTSDCAAATVALLGGAPAQVPSRYREAQGIVPTSIPVTLVHGAEDTIVSPALSLDYVSRAHRSNVTLVSVGDAGHFDVISPLTPAWKHIAAALQAD